MANYEFNFEDSNEEYASVEVVDPALETQPEQTIQIVGLEETEGFMYINLEEEETLVTDSESAFPAKGETNEELRHTFLTGRDLHDQHPVTAITGLREELNLIKSLKTVYSDKRYAADYYQWEDTNYYDENRVGYFVTVCEDANSIKICDGTNVFGVTVDQAAFAGGQNDIERGIDYGLVVHSGIAHVRCETDVGMGDCVISNTYGMAKKNDENYGFKVIGIEWVNGVKFAIVALNLSVDQIDAIGENITGFDTRLSDVEIDVLSAINLANEAYKKSIDAYEKAGTAVNISSNVSNNFEDVSFSVDENNQLVQQAIETSVQAQTIANSAIATAETLKREAVDVANEAIVEATNTKNEFIDTKDKMQQEVNNAHNRLDGAFEELKEIKDEIEPLAHWKNEDETKEGIAGFIARADENQTSLDILAGFEYGNNQTLYPYTNTPKDDNGNCIVGELEPINGIIFNDNGDKTITATGMASDNADFYIAQNLKLSEGEYSISGCAKNGSEETYYIIVKHTKADGTFSDYKDIGLYENIETEEIIKGGCRFNITDGGIVSIWIRICKGTSVDNIEFKPCLQKIFSGISGLRNQVGKNGSAIDLLTSFSSDDGTGVAGLIGQVSEHDSAISIITSWKDETSKSIAGTHTEASKNFAKMSHIAELNGNIAGFKQEVSSTYATNKSLTNFEGKLTSIEQTSNANGASIKTLVTNNDAMNKTVSQIRQDVNSISSEITNAKGGFANLSAKLSDTDSRVQIVTNWQNTTGSSLSTFMNNASKNFASATQVAKIVDANGNINTASIVVAVNNSDSSITLNANKINFNGFTTFIRPGDLYNSGTTTISGNRIRTGTIASNNYVYAQSGMAIDLNNGAIYSKNFSVNADGNVSISGNISASSGYIAGYTIGKSRAYPNLDTLHKVITYDDGTQCEVGIKASDGSGDLAFYITKSTNNWASKTNVFFVKNNGSMYATSGTIGGWNIKSDVLDSYVGSTKKRLYLSSGSNSANSWIKAYDENGIATFYITKEGVMHAKGAVIDGKITASSGNFDNSVTIGGSSITAGDLRKLFRAARLGYNDNDSLQIRRVDATSGSIGAWTINSDLYGVSSGGSTVRLGPTYVTFTGSSGSTRSATWGEITYAAVTSDKKLKDNINDIETKYDTFFDVLNPKTFTYKPEALKGDPNEIHFGFIAQDILSIQSNLNMKNLSLIHEEEHYGLKIQEFIALNTWQIQKAKARITELEEKVAKLEKLINDK